MKGVIEENTMHYVMKLECPEVMLIIAIKGLFLTVVLQVLYMYVSIFFRKSPWSAYNNITCTKMFAKKLF